MFTDDQATPVRLEILIDLLRTFPRGLPRDSASRLLQPESLGDNTKAAKATIKAALELELAREEAEVLKLAETAKKKEPRAAILEALDQRVLSNTETEPYFALFYAYMLGLDKPSHEQRRDRTTWVTEFNKAVFKGIEQPNQFNETKWTGLHRWLAYAGLGWYDPAEHFQPNPYDRLHRALPSMFPKQKKLSSEDWMEQLARTCPELDGGELFLRANPSYSPESKKCTLGLSHALTELDLDGVVRLYRPGDSAGWSIEDAEPPIEAASEKKGTRISFIELLTKH